MQGLQTRTGTRWTGWGMVILGSLLLIGFLFFGAVSEVLRGSSGMDVQIRPAWLAYIPIALSVIFVVGGSILVRRTRRIKGE